VVAAGRGDLRGAARDELAAQVFEVRALCRGGPGYRGRAKSANRPHAAHVLDRGREVRHRDDPDALDGPDLRHSEGEPRLLRLGRAVTGRVLIVAYTVRRRDDGESIRIISARRASRRERAAYASASED